MSILSKIIFESFLLKFSMIQTEEPAMLALNRQLADAQTAQDKTAIQRQIDATDSQIDRLVYELYRLTEEEIGIVEG